MSKKKTDSSPRAGSTAKKKTTSGKKRTSSKKAPAKKTAKKKSTKKREDSTTSFPVRFLILFAKLSLVMLVFALIGAAYLDANVRDKFEGKRWSVPAKVYAQPLELYPGIQMSAKQLEVELERLRYRKGQERPGSYSWVSRGQRPALLIHTRGFRFWDGIERSKSILVRFNGGRVSSIVDRKIAKNPSIPLVRFDPVLIGGIYPNHNEDRELVRLDQVPPELINTLLAVEDREFASHYGVSIKGIMRALFVNVSSGRIKQGGSTLTQQLVKNFYLSSERSLSRKAMEAAMSVLLELHYSKDEILQAYFNEVYLGQSGAKAIHGFGLASQFYFGHSISELDLHQSALLVGMVKGPSYYDPRRHPKRAITRRNQVLDVLVELQQISVAEADVVKQRPLDVIKAADGHRLRYPAFMDLLKRQLRRDYQDEDLSSEGLRIFTTLNPIVQQHTETAIKKTVNNLQKRGYGMDGQLQAAMVVSEPENGEVLAMVGDKDPRYAGFNRALDALRPVGSVIKPAVYLTALEKGRHFGEFVEDEAVELTMPDGQLWQPENFGKVSHGKILLQEGLINSYNLTTTRLGLDVGIESVLDVLRRGGIQRPLPEVPALFLGAVDLSPLNVAEFYQTIAANGFSTPLKAIREVTTSDGEPLNRYPLQVEQVFDSADVYLLTRVMQSVVTRGTGKRIYSRLDPELNIAGKTGTSNNQRDSWFVGITGNYLGVAWVGRDDNGPTRLTGATGAMAMWTELMVHAGPDPLTPLQPESVLDVLIDSESGKLSAKKCQGAVLVPMRIKDIPQEKTSCASGGWRRWFKRRG